MDQLPRLGKRELICLLLFTCNYVVSVWRGFLFLFVLGMGYVILLWHSLSLPYNYLAIPMWFVCYEGGSIYNGKTLITPPTKALAFYAIHVCGTKDQGLTFLTVYKILFFVSYLLRYRLLNSHTYIHLIHFIHIEKERLTKLGKYAVFCKRNR